MRYQKQGFPSEDEILLCTVSNVQYNSVFCTLDEYPNKSGMIHISEVTAGRIRNIREYVQEGKKVVCKVLHVDTQKGHIDLSLRRVSEGQRRDKNAAIKQEQKAEHIVEHLAKSQKLDADKLYQEISSAIFEHYEYLYLAFQDIVDDAFSLSKTKLDKKLAKQLEDAVKEKIKPKEVQVGGIFHISTYAENGVAKVRDALVQAREKSLPSIIHYLGAGQYRITVTAEEYKDAEKRLKLAIDTVQDAFKKVAASEVSFERVEAK